MRQTILIVDDEPGNLAIMRAILTCVFDALSMQRPHKQPWPIDKIVDYLQAGAGVHFDPELVQVFLRHLAAIAGYSEILDRQGRQQGPRRNCTGVIRQSDSAA
jgi:response regulator RpfG family c-di-GMP phosphodiesterase